MYVKVFESIMTSSLAEDYQTRHVFMDLLVLADPEGIVDMTPQAIARTTNVPLKIILSSIRKLCKPDPISRSKKESGCRLLRLDPGREWGWQIVNFKSYRNIRDENARRAYMRTYMRSRRAEEKARKQQLTCKPTVSPCSKQKHKQEAEAKTERENSGQPPAEKILSLSFPHGCSEKQRQATLTAITQAERAGVPYAFLEAAITSKKANGPAWKRIDDAMAKAGKIVEAVNEACGRKRFSDLQNLVDVATAEGYDESGRLAGLPAKVCGFSLRKILERCGATIGAEAPASAPRPAAPESPDPG